MTRNESHLASAFAAELAQVLEATTGERPTVETGAPVMAPAAEVLASRQEFTGGSVRDVWIAADPSGARQIGAKLLRAAGIEEHDEQEATSTYLETLRQALSSFSRTIGAREGREISCLEAVESRCPPDLALVPISVTFPGGTAITVYAHFRENEANPEPAPPSTARPDTGSLKNLDLLLDVELPVTVSFGRAQLPLKDVIKLTTGSTIELNRTVSEPVEVIVNNCVIAKGEVVVVDGNFAVRIERVVSRQDRLRSIG